MTWLTAHDEFSRTGMLPSTPGLPDPIIVPLTCPPHTKMATPIPKVSQDSPPISPTPAPRSRNQFPTACTSDNKAWENLSHDLKESLPPIGFPLPTSRNVASSPPSASEVPRYRKGKAKERPPATLYIQRDTNGDAVLTASSHFDDDYIHELNRAFRAVDSTHDILQTYVTSTYCSSAKEQILNVLEEDIEFPAAIKKLVRKLDMPIEEAYFLLILDKFQAVVN